MTSDRDYPLLNGFNLFIEASVAVVFIVLWAVTLRNAVTAEMDMSATFWFALMLACAGSFGVMVRQLVGRLP